MAVTKIRGTTQIKAGTVSETELATSVAGVGISGGGGSALALDLNELSAVAVDVSTDLVAIEDATDNSTKKESIADIVTAVAGVGLAASSGVMAVDLDELSAAVVDVSADSVAIIDATDNSTKKEAIADIVTAVAGDGLAASAGVLAVDLNELTAAVIDVSADEIPFIDTTDNSTKKESVADIVTAVAGDGLSATSGVLNVSVDSGQIVAGAVDVSHLSDLRVTEGTGLIADYAAGTLRNDNTIVSIAAGTVTVADDDVSYVEVDSTGSVTANQVGFTSGRVPLAEVTAVTGDITVVTDKRAWLDVEIGASGLTNSNFVDREVVAFDFDGVDTTGVLANTPVVGSEHVYLNGILQEDGGSADYTISGATITFNSAPLAGDFVVVSYRK